MAHCSNLKFAMSEKGSSDGDTVCFPRLRSRPRSSNSIRSFLLPTKILKAILAALYDIERKTATSIKDSTSSAVSYSTKGSFLMLHPPILTKQRPMLGFCLPASRAGRDPPAPCFVKVKEKRGWNVPLTTYVLRFVLVRDETSTFEWHNVLLLKSQLFLNCHQYHEHSEFPLGHS